VNPEATSFDAIVVGSGISGGWAAKELCEKGLKTLVLERGRNVIHIKDYPTMDLNPWELPHRGAMSRQQLKENPLISKAAGYGEDTAHFFVKDRDHPYVQEKPFDWIRGYQVGGKSIIWGRACQRWSKYEFTAPERQGYGINWPIGYDDVAPWYSHVERFIGVCGKADGLEAMPDGEYLPPFDFNCVEKHLSDKVRAHYGNRYVVQGRWAHLSQPKAIHLEQGRGTCQARNLCMRGCPYGGYFSSNSSTLPWAAKTGNLTIRPDSVVHSIIYDEAKGKATGVRVIDAKTHAVSEYRSRIVFVNASALNTNLILLNSTSTRFPHGLGNDSGLLGKYIAHHNYRTSANGKIAGFEDKYFYIRNPTECILVNFRNIGKQEMDFVGGYTTFTGAYRERGEPTSDRVGGDYKDALAKPGPWGIYMYMQGETIPKESNQVRLHPTQKDQWGIPLLVTSVGYDDNDEKMIGDWRTEAKAMLEVAGCHEVETRDNHQAPGLDIHEMGGARMGSDPKTSLLNKWNQLHACPNVFVTDGACMTSTGNQSPSILYMALTARAVDHAVGEMGKQNL
jgi:choline dehydrogenase-like flavoprotein